jgi:hypothetical protein
LAEKRRQAFTQQKLSDQILISVLRVSQKNGPLKIKQMKTAGVKPCSGQGLSDDWQL